MDMSFTAGMTILLVTAFVQAIVQFVLFMHAGESDDKRTIYTTLYYSALIALVTIFGSLLAMVWDM